MSSPRIHEILDFWFGDLDLTPDAFESRNQLWFMGGEDVDEVIAENFEKDVIAAAEGKLSSWMKTPKGSMALIILLDQFSLNIYREKPLSYLNSEKAIAVSRNAIKQGWEYVLTPAERVFLYMPLEHSENLKDQEEAVGLFQKLTSEATEPYRELMEGYLEYAIRHHRVVERFGRFPDRNEVFARESTPEELEFLESDEAPF